MPAVRQLARPTRTNSTGVAPLSSDAKTPGCHEDQLDRRGTLVLGREDLRVVGIEVERALVVLFLAQAEEALDGRAAVGAVHPFAGRSPLELRGVGRRGQRLAGIKQCLDIDAVVDGVLGFTHGMLLLH